VDPNEDTKPNEKWFEDLLELRRTMPLSKEAADLAIAQIRADRDRVPEWLQEMIDRRRPRPG
jgi:hypothetical protein